MNPAEFTSTYYIDRRGSHSRKWDGQHLKFNRTDLLPLWVADMDFMPPPMHTRGDLYLCESKSFRLHHDKSQVS